MNEKYYRVRIELLAPKKGERAKFDREVTERTAGRLIALALLLEPTPLSTNAARKEQK